MKKEQRRHSRVNASIPVTIRTESGGVFHGEIEDISLGGALIKCSQGFAAGESLIIELRFAGLKSAFGDVVDVDSIDDAGLIRAEEVVEVRWQRDGSHFGVKFAGLSGKTQKFLTRLVKFFESLQAETH